RICGCLPSAYSARPSLRRMTLIGAPYYGEHMANGVMTDAGVSLESVLRDCVATLQRVAAYRLPPALDRRLLWLSENKEKLSAADREELLAAVESAQERTGGKLPARGVLKRLAEVCPHLVPAQP